jgi:hypothetical protein
MEKKNATLVVGWRKIDISTRDPAEQPWNAPANQPKCVSFLVWFAGRARGVFNAKAIHQGRWVVAEVHSHSCCFLLEEASEVEDSRTRGVLRATLSAWKDIKRAAE